MARDTLAKLRNLLSMKSTLVEAFRNDLHLAQDLVEALRSDLAHAVSLIQTKDEQIQRLQDENYRLMMKGWEQQDKDEAWLADYLERAERAEQEFPTITARHIEEDGFETVYPPIHEEEA